MQQNQQRRSWWREYWFVVVMLALVIVVITITALGYVLRLSWTGFGGTQGAQAPTSAIQVDVLTAPKLLWDWLELLIIPIVLGAGAFWFNQQARNGEQKLARQQRENELEIAQRERENDRDLAQDRAREEALQRYLDRMQELILDKGLRRSKKDAEIRDVARARTLTVLRSLDGTRKGEVVRFLHEADLIVRPGARKAGKARQYREIEAIIDLRSADLRDADLTYAILEFAVLHGVDLSGASLRSAFLPDAKLFHADLSGASLHSAYLPDADLANTLLMDANLTEANLNSAILHGADLRNARGWTNEQLAQALTLVRATMPDGTEMTEEGWKEFKEQYAPKEEAAQ